MLSPEIERFRLNFRYRRMKKGIFQKTAAIRAGIARYYVIYLENGYSPLRKSQRTALAKAIKEDPEGLYKAEPPDIPLFLTPEEEYRIRLYLENYRKKLGVSLKAFCMKLETDRTEWKRALRLHRGLKPSTWIRFCDILGLDPKETLKG